MSKRVVTLVTSLRTEEAYAVIDLIDQLRSALVQTYGTDIRMMLQEAVSSEQGPEDGQDAEF